MTHEPPDGDPPADEDVGWLGRVRSAFDALRGDRVPATLHERLVGLLDRPGLARYDAQVSYDSLSAALAPGWRSGRMLDERQLSFTADDLEVLVAIGVSPSDVEQFELRGQVLADAGDFAVQLVADGVEVALVHCDDLGEFVVDGLEAGRYELNVAGADVDITIAELDVG